MRAMFGRWSVLPRISERQRRRRQSKIEVSLAELTMVPDTRVKLSEDSAKTMLKLLDVIEDNDDVQSVYAITRSMTRFWNASTSREAKRGSVGS